MYIWTHAGIAKQKKFIAEERHTAIYTDTQLPRTADTQLLLRNFLMYMCGYPPRLMPSYQQLLIHNNPQLPDTQLPTATDTQLPTATDTQLPTAAAGVSGDISRTLSELQ